MNILKFFDAERDSKFEKLEEVRDYFSVHQWQFLAMWMIIFFVVPLIFFVLFSA